MSKGYQHPTLNGDHSDNGKQAANSVIEAYERATGIAPAPTRLNICDYGCGSLRIGLHLMKRQDQGCYIGVDVVDNFINAARESNFELIAEKKPTLGTLDENLSDAIAKAPDIVFAYNVVNHVHVDEVDEFYSNLRALAHKPGCLVILHVLVCETPIRFQRSGWAWPRQHYIEKMNPSPLIKYELGDEIERNEVRMRVEILTFRTPKSEFPSRQSPPNIEA